VSSNPSTAEGQVFQARPTEAQFAVLLDADGRSIALAIEDTPERLVVQPQGYPLWFVAACLAVPFGGITGILVYGVVEQHLQRSEILFLVLMLTGGACAAALILGLFRWLNRQIVAPGDFFIVDKARRILILPRRRLQFQDGDILGFVEVRAWHTEGDRGHRNGEWMGELSVLVRAGSDAIARHPVVTCMRTDTVARLAQTLAGFFGVERQLLKLDWRTRRRLRAGGAPAP
jgi:hypothetical protein